MQKRYPEALEYIEKAVANDPQEGISAVVLEHAGDIAFMANDVQKALQYWEKHWPKMPITSCLSKKSNKRNI